MFRPSICSYDRGEFSHYGKLGDFVYALGAIRQYVIGSGVPATIFLYPEPRINADQNWKLTPMAARSLEDLALSQDYVTAVDYGYTKVGSDLLGWRDWAKKRQSILGQCAATMGIPVGDWMHEPWLRLTPEKSFPYQNVINWTPRYYPVDVDWKKLLDSLEGATCFMGTRQEYLSWKEKTKTDVPYFPTSTILEASKAIAASRLFIGTQSALFAIASALTVPRILISSRQYPNCYWGSPECLPLTNDTPLNTQRIRWILSTKKALP